MHREQAMPNKAYSKRLVVKFRMFSFQLRSLMNPWVAAEIDGAAIADEIALIVKCKATLDSNAALYLGCQLGVIS